MESLQRELKRLKENETNPQLKTQQAKEVKNLKIKIKILSKLNSFPVTQNCNQFIQRIFLLNKIKFSLK